MCDGRAAVRKGAVEVVGFGGVATLACGCEG
jgi:hypothetical protein